MNDPVDRYILGTRWLAFLRPEFSGIVLWGRIDAEVLRALAALVPARSLPTTRPHPMLVDVRLVDSVDPDVLQTRDELFAEHADSASRLITRIAVLHPTGLVGAITRGIAAIAPPPFPEEFFTDRDEGLAWLGKEHEAPMLDELEHIRAHATAASLDLNELRSILDARRRLSLSAAAKAVGLSVRSFQRRLAAIGTSYQREMTLATVRVAQRLLLEPGAKVGTVALEVACASPQHLVMLFRKVVGETPSAWRYRQLASDGIRASREPSS